MSHIMDKLKKLETTVGNEPRQPQQRTPATMKTVKYPATKSGLKLIITLTAIVAFGIFGYIAGTSSRKGDIGKRKKPSGVVDIAQTQDRPISVPISPDIIIEKPIEDISVVDPDIKISETTERPVTVDPEEKKAVILEPPLAKKDIPAIAQETHPAAEQKQLVYEKSGKSGSMIAGDQITALASAIIKATDEPITEKEDLLNKKTIQKLKVLGVVKEKNEMVAIVSGQEVKEGDIIRQFTVEKITEEYLLLSFRRTFYRKSVR